MYPQGKGTPPGPPPPRSTRQPSASVPDITIDTAVEARIARELADEANDRLKSLSLRVTQLEATTATRHENKSFRNSMVLAVVGTIGSLAVGIVLWALSFATTAKKEAVSQSKEATNKVIETAKAESEDAYARGARDGAREALEQARKDREAQEALEAKGAVVIRKHELRTLSTRP
jgi:flagellar biosynthesis/type III secretory pathway protein FliH